MPEKDFKKNLSIARRKEGAIKKELRNIKKIPQKTLSAWKQINLFIDWLYAFALIAAITKDIVDYVGIGSLPAIGTVITILCSIFIAFIMLLTGNMDIKASSNAFVKRYLILIGGTLMELLFGLNFIPFESLVVIVIYIMVLIERSRHNDAKKEIQKL